jgi:hypothetical protein
MNRTASMSHAVAGSRPYAATFSKSVLAALAISAVLKLSGVLSAITELDKPDPVFAWFSVRQVMFAGALLEAAVAWALVRWRDTPRALGLITWLACVFLLYRGAAWLNGWTGPCGCLGGRYGLAYFVPVYWQDWLAKALLGWMLVGGALFLLRERGGRQPLVPETRPTVAS